MNLNSKIKNILFPTDFSELSENALETAIEICKRQDARLHVLHVIENGFMLVPREAHNSAVYLMPQLQKSGEERLTQLAGEVKKKYGMDVKIHLKSGNPAERIGLKAMDLKCELIVMGTHGASGVREFFIGSNSYSVIKNTGVPVLTIPSKKRIKEFNRILFPIRITKGILDKYEFIQPIIRKNNAELFIAGLSLPGEDYKLGPLDEEIRELGKHLRINNTRFKSENFTCTNYAKKVLEIAKKEKADLIVINATLDYNWKQFFIGPYVQQIVNHSKIPVLSMRTVDSGISVANPELEENTATI